MNFIFTAKLNLAEVELLFCPVLQSAEQIAKLIFNLDLPDQNLIISRRLKQENFQGKSGQTFIISGKTTVVLAGLGRQQKFSAEDWRESAGVLVRFLEKHQAKKIGLISSHWLRGSQDIYHWGQSLAIGLTLANYNFSKYKKQDDKLAVDIQALQLELKNNQRPLFTKGWNQGLILARGVNQARDLVNEPARIMTPEYLANFARSLTGRNTNIKIKILEKEECAKMGMEAFLSVAAGSTQAPKFIHLIYSPPSAPKKNKVAIVGKGITFDSGGLNIKHDEGMVNMKIDMGGAATVLGLFSVLPQLKPRVEVHGIIAACENMPSGSALKPGDVVKNMQGKTIEIANTDAEGRVTLADSLAYAQKKGLKIVVDLATLTGAVLVALGDQYAGLFTNNDELGKNLVLSSAVTGEKIWLLPLPPEYKDLNKSLIANLRNIPSTRYGGAIAAALFLQEFIQTDVSWAHLDIAGPVYAEKPFNSYTPAGGVGFGVRTLAEWLKKF